jgi:plastocyanin
VVPTTPVQTVAVQPLLAGTDVDIVDDGYLPSRLTIQVGAAVIWRNFGGKVHDAQSKDGKWASLLLQPGMRMRVEFPVAGLYEYQCTYHPGMEGRISAE